jgi:hypothetical protein
MINKQECSQTTSETDMSCKINVLFSSNIKCMCLKTIGVTFLD